MIKIYDLCGADASLRFSPYCWRTKMALKHKGLPFETVAWKFTDKDAIASSGQGRVPVLLDGDRVVHDSMDIALYLDTVYPDAPALMSSDAERTMARFINNWAFGEVQAALIPLLVGQVFEVLDDADKPYFRESREAMLKAPLESLVDRREAAQTALTKVLKSMEHTLSETPFLGGDAPFYGDYIVFGPMQWARTVGQGHVLDASPNVRAWFERCLDLFDGYARNATHVKAA